MADMPDADRHVRARRGFLRHLLLGSGAAMLSLHAPFAAAAEIRGVRVGPHGSGVRLVFDLSGPLAAPAQMSASGDVLQVLLPGVRSWSATPRLRPLGSLLGVRKVARSAQGLAVDLAIQGAVHWRSFSMRPAGHAGYRWVLDLLPDTRDVAGAALPLAGRGRPIVICLDPGHGGHDPGAIGQMGTREKDVVLDVGLRLGELLRQTPGVHLVMTRDSDRYVPLLERMELGVHHRADLFVSVHADAFPLRTVRGSTVWALSEKGASNEAARWLAKTQNAADPILADVQGGQHNPLLNQVLLNMSQTAAMNSAASAADVMIRGLAGVEDLHNAQVQHANFVVLRAPDVPSMLVETAFISNPEEEQHLRDPAFRDLLAHTMRDAIVAHFVKAPPAGSCWSSAQHVVSHEESLADVAKRYGVNARILRLANHLDGREAFAGQRLRVPIMGA
ncbi:N-acetylmuramoyl-L-alanine amidase [Acidithiobacillus sulfuriphilus]|uniref:N-acetylmuramoyl-L-alanine amidase n=2 Tax=Acidithiobacillus sulfuriphilus TaxID=1867749 RepID=A0ACD5HND8_9PROT|nr:N-acetylmuramoyl-L-alanine amidase [Acidithiobacillus sulfuriphilus]